jgi:hypothetical protein
MERADPRRRIEPEGELGASVQRVLERRQLVAGVGDDLLRRRLGDALEPDERPAQRLEQSLDGCPVPSPFAGPDRPFHAAMITRAI